MTVMAVPLAETPLSALERHKQASQIQTEDEIKSFMETRFHEFEQNIRLRRLSGYYSSLASVLAHRYYEFQGDIRAYSLCFYYSILEHAFCPANRLREHNILTPGNRIIPLDFFSILTLISFNLRACQLYSEGRILGRRKYLRFWNHSYMLEAFKGIEYLARLYYLKADNKGIGQVFQKILVDSKLLDEEQAKALWEFRCGIAHRGTLYNVNNKKVFRFGYPDAYGISTEGQEGCIALLAGPGAGKTETLAQRADFLLRTGVCPYPKRILAISFKKDASENLKERVAKRCGAELAARFDSYTFHAFGKRMIDIFRTALKGQDVLDQDYTVGEHRIPRSQITFNDMVPLANEVLNECSAARNAIQATYSDVFLDEFQDCTNTQYSLVLNAFQGSGTRIIAVGEASGSQSVLAPTTN